ncbi:hypothetical protein DPM33_07575 [Mesorhizobium hawassense]|uniref:DUF3592 domain-containing protein n=1 Tax=Mesorhizobium hawassense TaxID=1209954 RepID=A0A330HR75_9HYPH|nr:hypothetical protein [Mesorhizobium hawassense]RAZ91171.1 hypothetical protein DPM33_07575 [Mesorhizobium hawassense]
MIGGFCLLVAVFCARDMITKSNWPRVPAEVVAVKTESLMESTQHRIIYKTVSSASIPCEMVDAFKAMYADKEWTVTRKFTGTLHVGAGADAVETTLDLHKSGDREPQAGDKLMVVQNPARPAQIQDAGRTGSRLMITVGAAVIGALCLFFAFRRRRPPSAAPTTAGLAGDNAARARKEDAMIAAALTKQAALPGQGAAGRQAAATQAREARFSGRASFGRRN